MNANRTLISCLSFLFFLVACGKMVEKKESPATGERLALAPLDPDAPSKLTARALSSSSVRLNWINNAVNPPAAIVVERYVNKDKGYVQIMEFSDVSVTRATINGLATNRVQYFKVGARKADGTVAYSRSARVTLFYIVGTWTTPGTYFGNANGQLAFNSNGTGMDSVYVPITGAYGHHAFSYTISGNQMTITGGCSHNRVFCMFYTGDTWAISIDDVNNIVLNGGYQSAGVYSISTWRGFSLRWRRR